MQGEVCYRIENNTVKFFENIIKKRQIQSVTMHLVVATGDGINLTISPDLVTQIIDEGYRLFVTRGNPDMINDSNPVK